MLHLSMSQLVYRHHSNKRLWMSIFLTLLAQHGMAQTVEEHTPVAHVTQTEMLKEQKNEVTKQGLSAPEVIEKIELMQNSVPEPDSMQMLQQQESSTLPIEAFKPIEFEALEDLPIASVDQNMASEILQVAEDAKREAQNYRATQNIESTVADITQQELTQINQAPVNVDELMSSIRADSEIVVSNNESGNTLAEAFSDDLPTDIDELNIFQRLLHKVRPSKQPNIVKVSRITADVIIANNQNSNETSTKEYATALNSLKANIEGKLSSFTVESFSDFPSALPQLRTLSNQAAQAVGFYNSEFKFEKVSDSKVKVTVTPNSPVLIQAQNVEFSGAGENQAQFQVIRVLPDQDVGDILNHGAYENTKVRITDAATNNGYFDSYWRLHDVKVAQPQNTADINLRYETGERYKLGNVEFRMNDPNIEFPLDADILQSLVTWEDGADYTFWRVNGLANNLTNSRYFNYTLVDAIKPDAIVKPLELPDDLQALVDQEKVAESAFSDKTDVAKTQLSDREVTQDVVNEDQFAGTQNTEASPVTRQLQVQQKEKESEEELKQAQARENKKIPVIVTLNADRLNSLETGIGYGTDTGVRLRSQYRRAIVNHLGHSFDANFELSEIRQSIDARYNIPYKHPLNDYFSLVAGYEREDRSDIGNDLDLVIESAVAGVDRIIKGSRKEWQHILGVRYRLDRVTQNGAVDDIADIPDAFLIPGSNQQQQSLLLGYQATKTTSDNRVNPTQGFKQSYKIQLGSESLLSDTDMAIVNADWKALYSLGKNDDHQILGGLSLGYIFAKDFELVPYNLRFFAGGDQSLRGFDYKSLSPIEYGYKVGGQALAVGTVEYNYQFKDGWRAAIFSDFGNAYDKSYRNDTEYSLGLGIRWKSPIGPIRIDVASGVSDPDHPIRLHFFIGSQL